LLNSFLPILKLLYLKKDRHYKQKAIKYYQTKKQKVPNKYVSAQWSRFTCKPMTTWSIPGLHGIFHMNLHFCVTSLKFRWLLINAVRYVDIIIRIFLWCYLHVYCCVQYVPCHPESHWQRSLKKLVTHFPWLQWAWQRSFVNVCDPEAENEV
jgi:hypothetical protein